MRSRDLVWLVAVLSSVVLRAQPERPAAAAAISVFFTGRQFGYFRFPDRQTWDQPRGCPADSGATSPEVKAFLEAMAVAGGGEGPHVLVGLGDTFSPNLWSRFIYQDGPASPQPRSAVVPKDVVLPFGDKWIDVEHPPEGPLDFDGHANDPLLTDNVACFLQLVHYDALVPGKHDFYYGPKRLQQLGQFLAERDTHLLAVNLAVITTDPRAGKRVPDPKGAPQLSEVAIRFPWMQTIVVKNAYAIKDTEREITPSTLIWDVAEDGRTLILRDQGKEWSAFIEWTSTTAHVVPIAGGATVPAIADFRALKGRPADRSGVFRLPLKTWLTRGAYSFYTTSRQEAAAFAVERPLLGGEGEAPYTLKCVDGQWVAIFGVVESDLKEHVGELNYAWNNVTNPAYSTTIGVADPTDALQQALGYCQADTACRTARKILLAQMPYDQAQLLAGSLHTQEAAPFELVLAQTDERHAAVAQEVTRADTQPFVLSPDSMAISDAGHPGNLLVNLYRAVLSRADRTVSMNLTTYAKPTRFQGATGGGQQPYRSLSEVELLPSSRVNLQTTTLQAMRGEYNTDVAMLQARDLYELPNTLLFGPLSVQEKMDTVLWKGDFVVQVALTGAQLTSLVEQSDVFNRADSNGLTANLETGRGLKTLGLTLDPDGKTLVVNGATVDPNKLYSVATTDYLAYGDTGYAAFAAARPLPISDLVNLTVLSRLVCRAIGPPSDCSEDPSRKASPYFDTSRDAPLLQTQSASGFADLAKWAAELKTVHAPPATPTAGGGAGAPAEQQAQDHTFWTVALEKSDLTYSAYQHTPAAESALQTAFAGTPQTQVLTPNSSAFGHDYRLRVTRSTREVDGYLLSEDSYERDNKGTSNDSVSQSQASNLIAGEAGLIFRLPTRRSFPSLRPLVGLRYEQNLVSPLTAFTLASGALVQSTRTVAKILPKIGLRWESKSNWVEFGFQPGKVLHAPVGYRFLDADRQTILGSCQATTGTSLSTCVKGASGSSFADLGFSGPITSSSHVEAISQDRRQHSIYLNFKFQVPLFHKNDPSVQYVIENTGTAYQANGHGLDFSVDPRYLDVWTQTLNVKIAGPLSLAPKIQFLFYSTMVDRNRMHSRAISVSVAYSFSWHNGLSFLRAMSYTDPSQKGSPAVSK
jgi:2',3'-cyclic-nucleotide 2'-phosphodiesterase (5'-nucleotidase family)